MYSFYSLQSLCQINTDQDNLIEQIKSQDPFYQLSLDEQIKIGKQILMNGGVFAFPTETVYGLGAICTNTDGVLNVYKTKQRPPTDPLIVHISNIEMIHQVAIIKDFQKQAFDILTKSFWPGPMTIVLEKKPCVPDCCTADQNTVGIRFPRHQIAQKLIEAVGIPIAAPSANKFGHISGTCAQDIIKEWNGQVKVLDGGACAVGIESTVLQIRQNNTIHIFRRGGITESMIQEAFKKTNININITYNQVSQSSLNSPGTLTSHYAVKTARTYIITLNGLSQIYNNQTICNLDEIKDIKTSFIFACKIDEQNQKIQQIINKISQENRNYQQIYDNPTKHFFSALHFAEKLNSQQILIFPPEKYFINGISSDIDASVFDRMYRSCSGHIINLSQQQ